MTTESILIYTTETPRKRSGCNDPRCCDQNFYEYDITIKEGGK